MISLYMSLKENEKYPLGFPCKVVVTVCSCLEFLLELGFIVSFL
jgi:hypothetical protein